MADCRLQERNGGLRASDWRRMLPIFTVVSGDGPRERDDLDSDPEVVGRREQLNRWQNCRKRLRRADLHVRVNRCVSLRRLLAGMTGDDRYFPTLKAGIVIIGRGKVWPSQGQAGFLVLTLCVAAQDCRDGFLVLGRIADHRLDIVVDAE